MTLPWTHAVFPVVRNIPCDIDEMPEILAVDDGTHTPFENGPFGFGNFAMGQMQSGAQNLLVKNSVAMRTAARRSVDSGIIELSTVTLRPDEVVGSPSNEAPTDLSYSKGDALGEVSLRCFELEQQWKKRRVEQAKSLTRKQYISVKINSTSSRSSLLPKTPLMLFDAKLPAEVQEARFLSMSRAKKISEELGSYDWRHGLAPTNASGKNANRVSVGRTRRMWTAKSPADKPQRVFFTSLLTGGRLDTGTQKRPRDVRLAVKVNGEYFQSESSANLSISGMEEWPETKVNVLSAKQCTFDSNKMVSKILKSQIGKAKSQSASGQEIPLITPAKLDCVPDNTGIICISCTVPGSIATSSVHSLLNQAAQQESAVCTICWSTGCRELGALQECSGCGVLAHPQCCFDTGVFNNTQLGCDGAAASRTWLCSVCFHLQQEKARFNTDDSIIVHYRFSGILVQQEKAGAEPQASSKNRRRISRPPAWLKDSHIKAPTSKVRLTFQSPPDHCEKKCSLCPFSGGAMSLVEANGVSLWIHEVCRIWTDFGSSPVKDPRSAEGRRSEKCALCGVDGANKKTRSDTQTPTSNCLVKCAAARCRVYFHPMCALLVSKLTGKHFRSTTTSPPEARIESSLHPQILKDLDLASRYTLTAIDCEAAKKDTGEIQSLQIPVCFCGIHNPAREASMYGLYPGGEYIDKEVVRVPPYSDRNKPKLATTADVENEVAAID
jgi:hypothetical protein